MRVLSVAERELRARARHRGLYHLRWGAAAGALVFLIWLGWVENVFQNKSAGPDVFRTFAVVLFLYCLFVGAAATADGISRERRDGTLGLLFLTNLNSFEIVTGKLCAHALALVYSLLAIFPVLALPLMIGGITLEEFWRTILALWNGLFLAVALGFVASVLCVRQFPAVALATGLTLGAGLGLLGLAEALRGLRVPRSFTDWLATACPLQTLLLASDLRRGSGPVRFWFSLPAVAAITGSCFGFVTWWLSRTWRDRPKSRWRLQGWGWGERWRDSRRAVRAAFRRRWLAVNPIFWLASRHRISAPVVMGLISLAVLLTTWLTGPTFSRVIPGGTAAPVLGHMFAWMWTGLAVHALVLYYAANTASQRLAEDKQTGALELLLCVPGTERSLSRGLWLAYGRKMLFPALSAVLIHAFFIWIVLNLMLLDPPNGRLPPGVTPVELLWCSLLGQPLKGLRLDWQFGMILRLLVFILAGLMAYWVMLGWLGRWLGLRMKHPGFAPLVALVLAAAPPTLAFSLVCYVFAELRFFRMPAQQFVPMMLWIAMGIVLSHCAVLSGWAALHLRRDLRSTVTSRYEPPLPGAWWRAMRRLLLRFAMGGVALTLIVAIMVLSFYGYQNWRSKRSWTAFQKQLQKQQQSLRLADLLPAAVPWEQNFAKSPAFREWLAPLTNRAVARLLQKSRRAAAIDINAGSLNLHADWMQQQGFSKLDQDLAWLDPSSKPGSTQDRTILATAVVAGLKSAQSELDELATAARLPAFQCTSDLAAPAVFESNRPELLALEQIQLLLELRAIARLNLNQPTEAAADVQTSLRLAELAGQSPDVSSPLRLQVMLIRSLQPLWEGLAEHRWNEPQLAQLQSSLTHFDLLSHQTNMIRRIVAAYVESWGALPQQRAALRSLPQGGGTYVQRDEWEWQPRGWWYDNCIQLYEAGQKAIARVDVARSRVIQDFNWSDLNGLPLDSASLQALQQWPWGNTIVHVSLAQSSVNQAIIACALERYRLAWGSYPDSLDQLVPAYLPTVPCDTSRGLPMSYERGVNEPNYVLRAAGWDGIINRGQAMSDDWVWSFTSLTNKPAKPVGR